MKKYKVEFECRDRNARGLHFKKAKRTVTANTETEAIQKIEQALMETITNPKVTEVAK